MSGAPWTTPPDWWSLDGCPLRVRVPPTSGFVTALSLPDRGGAGLWMTLECTDPADRWRIVQLILQTRLDLDVLDDVADALVERIAGWKRWRAAYVWRRTLGVWPTIDGDLLAGGTDVSMLSPARATNVVWAWWRRNLSPDKNEWSRFVRDMDREPVRVVMKEAEQPMDSAVFGQLKSRAKAGRAAESELTSVIRMPDPIR